MTRLPYSFSIMAAALWLMGWWSGTMQRADWLVFTSFVVGVAGAVYTLIAWRSRRVDSE